MNCLIFAIATAPDLDAGRHLHQLQGIDDEDVATALSTLRYQQTDGGTDRLPAHLQRVVTISLLESRDGELDLCRLGADERDEQDLLERFFDRVRTHERELVSWDGAAFALPVLNYRALVHALCVPWQEDDGILGWPHTDLRAALSAPGGGDVVRLDEIARLLGFPGGIDADAGADTQRDVLNAYLIYLRLERLRGHLSAADCEQEYSRLREWLWQSGQESLQAFLQAWGT